MTVTATHRSIVCVLSTTCLLGFELAITKTTAFGNHPLLLSIGLLFDCTVLTTALFYGLVARPLQMPISRTVLFSVAMLRVALFILPATPSCLSGSWPIVIGLLEGTVLGITVLRFRDIRQTYLALRLAHDSQTALYGAFSVVFGYRVARIILSEGQVMYYALLNWQKRIDLPAGATPVTTHHKSGQVALLIALLGVGLIEAMAMHIVLTMWSPTVAFWVTLVSLYGCLMVLAIINTIQKRPSFRTDTALHLRLDMRWEALILLDNIAAITPVSDKPAKRPGLLNAALLTAPNVLITLREPVTFNGIYGLSRTVTRFSLFIDDLGKFL